MLIHFFLNWSCLDVWMLILYPLFFYIQHPSRLGLGMCVLFGYSLLWHFKLLLTSVWSNPSNEVNFTFLRLSPWEMLSAVRKAVTRWVMEPASPQWGRNWKVFSPRSLGGGQECRISCSSFLFSNSCLERVSESYFALLVLNLFLNLITCWLFEISPSNCMAQTFYWYTDRFFFFFLHLSNLFIWSFIKSAVY